MLEFWRVVSFGVVLMIIILKIIEDFDNIIFFLLLEDSGEVFRFEDMVMEFC